jgi:N4-gp56 family major capsid protein
VEIKTFKGMSKTYGLVDPALLKSLTTIAELDSTIPHVWSPRVEQTYLDNIILTQFAVINTELLNRPGDEVEINRLNDIGPAVDMEDTGPTGEASINPEQPWDNSTVVETAFTTEQLCVLKPGMKFKAVRFTKKALNRSFVNVMGDATMALGHSLALKREQDCFQALSAGTQVVTANSGGNTAWTALTASEFITTDVIRDAKEIFDVNVKLSSFAYFPGGTCVCLIHPHQFRDLTDDTKWFDVVKRNAEEKIFRGEMTEWDGVRFVKSTVVKFYVIGATSDVSVAEDMATLDDIDPAANPVKRWYFATIDGTFANRKKYIVPRYQAIEVGGSLELLTIALDGSDLTAKVTVINYRDGWVEFDTAVGASSPPRATFSHSTDQVASHAGYEALLIGKRSFAIAEKARPEISKELRNYQLFIGIGATVDYAVRLLNNEQVIKIRTAG